MHLKRQNTEQICAICGFQILMLHVFCINNALGCAISRRKQTQKVPGDGLALSPVPIRFSTPNQKLKMFLGVHLRSESPGLIM